MKLAFVAPTPKNGRPTTGLLQSSFEIEVAKWKSSIILYVVSVVHTIKYLNTYIRKHWPNVMEPEIYIQIEGYFVIRYKTII